ncbi:DNA polymerase III subunit alpha [Bacteroides sp.]|uniref:DNA polymerase III subunit alpha n=1 Tax=Bacteroides sp. TaxID=29523 RepID=UPI001B4808D1|nr:DNA polymerase III subunit alpha [Bacteroides sp.]MBP6065840.1 DNA polymerase III subunit alpha [Bacteroides sp.]MBP6067780.1 DNA polymerase III subunit alpha [Bacteroides sp.]MBP6937347.1 DNA polymerase III subunit alpha [Bacteroides sp.]MBP8622152.1 DNA polymerase III subunit alpha [Bacteroides sp.]MBP9586946.1 DNA polymerase III subunit alpha [Bacteroides sp.]
MQDFVHLHVHTQYSLLDGQASVSALVDKAMKDGMKGIAVTDHGNMFGIKEFTNYVNKKNSGPTSEIKQLKKRIAAIEHGKIACDNKEAEIADCQRKIAEAQAKLFKPIIGCEMYVARRTMDKKEGKPDQGGYHLIVLAKNKKGYHNLIKLVSRAWTQGYYMRPRTDRNELEKYREGLIICSACLGGEVPRKITQGLLDEAEEAIRWYKNLFGDDYYLELQRHKATVPRANQEAYPLQANVNTHLIELSRKCGVKLICTNDVHFVSEEHAEAHDRLICLSTGKDLDDPKRMLYTKQEWMKTREEMNRLFEDVPEALSNTLEVLDKVEYYSIDHAPIMPTFAIPETFGTEEEYRKKYTEEDLFQEFTRDENGNVVLDEEEAEAKIQALGGCDKLYRIKLEADYLAELTFEGAKKFYGDPLAPEVKERLVFELYIMKTMGFPGYFLIVQDFIAAGREMGVSVGPGRGSAAGSAVAYCLQITKIDPIRYDLLFERFLNPDRISLPDIDIDFDDDGRGQVLRWVTEKYGAEKVAHIITYGTMATKSAIKDVARVQKLPLSESDRLTKLVPDRIPDKKLNLRNAIDYVPELQAAEASPNPQVRDTIKYAKMLEGNVRGTGVHACGTIICRDDITDWVPVSTADDKETGEKMLVTQYEGSVIEDTGLIKMDFLGLKTLSIIKEAVENIRLSHGIEIDIDAIDITDPVTYKLYSDGRTVGTFQFESAGMQKYLRELQPTTFEDLIAMNALYRPGPMEYIPEFVDRKHGRKPIEYDIPVMEKYLKETYGITVYQEQVMLLSRLLADFTRGESDALRKAMGKKLRDKLDQMKPKFIEGGRKNGHNPKVLEKIWGDWEKFASYAFNKSHATCYSWVAYQTAYLKANYPAEYMAAVMSRSLSNITDITKLMDECKAMGMAVLGPDVNESNLKFTVNKEGNIRFGLGAVKGVGEAAVQSIIDERRANGPFTGIFDFVQRVNLTACSKKNMECIALAGGFDSFPELNREQFFVVNARNETFLETLMRYGNRYQTDKAAAVNSLFGGENVVDIATPEILPAERWGDLERLNKERELIGIYLSAHPLDEYAIVLNHVCNTRMIELDDKSALAGREITMGGIVTAVRRGISKNGNPYGIAKIEDYSGSTEIPFFGNDWVTYQGYLYEGTFLYMKARCQAKQWRQDELEVKITSMELLSDVKDQLVEKITIILPLSAIESTLVNELSTLVSEQSGPTELYFKISDPDENMYIDFIARPVKLSVGKQLISFLNECPELEFRIN